MQTFTFQSGSKQYSPLQSILLWELLKHLLNHSTYLKPVFLKAGASELFSTVDYVFCASSIQSSKLIVVSKSLMHVNKD